MDTTENTNVITKIISFFKNNVVMSIALLAAIVTSIIILPNEEYLSYFDLKTLTCLFCVLAVVCALKNINFFYILANKVVSICKNAKIAVLALVYITFIGSMIIANDMALLTFLPLGFAVLSACNKQKYMIFTFVMQNIAANLGGMLTPFGNPQNLYLYTKFNIPTDEFVQIMFPPFMISIILITICCLFFVKSEPLVLKAEPSKLNIKRAILYFALFALAIAVVFRGIPFWIGLIIIPCVLLFFDRKALRDVDYPLLLTFVFFFIFAGNMSRIPVINDFFSYLMNMNTTVFSAILCQFISNVPSAILLSQFTGNYAGLLLGVNIGGVGTIIASLASLITLSEFRRHFPEQTKKYMLIFSAFNFGFLIILLAFVSLPIYT